MWCVLGLMLSLAGLAPISGSVSLDWSGIFADELASYRNDYGRFRTHGGDYWTKSVIQIASLSGSCKLAT